jgi:hypothetical protein
MQQTHAGVNMKALLVLTLLLSLTLPVIASGQSTLSKPSNADKTTAPEKAIEGFVKLAGEKVSLIADKNQKAWTVENPEMLTHHAGRHVRLKALVDTQKSSIRVTNVKMLIED